jgi:hypothetical protein
VWQDLTTVEVWSASGNVTLTGASLAIKAYARSLLTMDAGVEGEPQDPVLVWTVSNPGEEEVAVQPLARRLVRGRTGFEPVGDAVLGQTYELGGADPSPTPDGWVTIPAGGTVRVSAAPGAVVGVDAVVANVRYLDVADGIVRFAGIWEHVAALLEDPLVVVATDPPDGAHVEHLGLMQITATYDRAIQAGAGLGGVTVASGTETKSVFATVDGDVLRIFTTTPLGGTDLGGTAWTVTVPPDAAVDALDETPLAAPCVWTFTVTGVN